MSEDISGELLEVLKAVIFADKGITEDEIAQKFNISKPKANYYFDELIERDLIERGISMGMGPTHYYGTKEGRKYLFDRDLL